MEGCKGVGGGKGWSGGWRGKRIDQLKMEMEV